MRIAVVCPYDLGRPGGVQQLCRELVDRLRLQGDDAILIGPGHGAGWESVGGTISLRGNRSRVPLALAPAVWARVADITSGFDLLHVHEPLAPLVGPAALRSGRRVVATFHADPSRWVRRLYRLGSRPAGRLLEDSIVTAVSPTAASALPERWGPIRLVPNAVAVASFPKLEKVGGRVLFLGRDEPRKGFDVLESAWPAVEEAEPGARLVVAGFERSEALPGVAFLGRVSEEEKRKALAEAEVFVAPNLGGESFGIVLAEAMAAGAAIVASDLPAFRDVAGDAALFVPPGDPRALGSAIGGLLADHEHRQALARAAMSRAARYDWPVVIDAYRAAYAAALESL